MTQLFFNSQPRRVAMSIKKSVFRLFSFFLAGMIILASANIAQAANVSTKFDTTSQTLTGTLKVWSFTNELQTQAIAFQGKNPGVTVEFTNIPMTEGEYQTSVLAAAGTAGAPDVVGLEAAFVKEWVES